MEFAGVPVRRIGERIVEGIDPTLLVLILTISMLGLAALYSASIDMPSRVMAQVINLAVAIADESQKVDAGLHAVALKD